MVDQYNFDKVSFQNLKNITIPSFQRGLVWNSKKRRDLISTLHEGYPFGVLLVASNISDYDKNDNDAKNWQLLDGQQRLSTIIDYEKNPIPYWKPLNKENYDNARNKISKILIEENISELDEKEFDCLLNVNDYELVDRMTKIGIKNLETVTKITSVLEPITRSIKDFINVQELQIPIIKFTGKSTQYPKVFENLNKGGTPLNKYEIYNAAWINANVSLDDKKPFVTEIVDNVINYYKNMENNEFELSKPAEEIVEDNMINLAEFGRSLGEFAVKRLPSITSKKIINEIGFGILGIATNTPNQNIGMLNNFDKIEFIQENYETIFEKVDKISKKLNDSFSKILSLNVGHSKGGVINKYTDGLSTVFKTLSYYADLWNLDDRQSSIHLANIKVHYVYDYLNRSWGSKGDSRLNDYYPLRNKSNYSTMVNEDSFKFVFKDWISVNEIGRRGFSKQTKALTNIFANLKYKDTFRLPGQDDEFEHIIPRKRIQDFDKESQVNLNSLGNCMVLPKYLNSDKKSLTIYEYRDKITEDNNEIDYSDLIKKSNYPTNDTFKSVFSWLENENFDNINKFLEERSDKFACNFIKEIMNNK
ncbi:DUF262 domain-containing protein [Convivina intestini]|uniref:DUF262 domain-containing protein n=1 Tax=Convivina intestini TaxID=1505726 RepID=UPI00200E0B5D|nr:DUF262 domain-containing protein [Convivina intestini]CAH1856995.1 hypothetical protein R078131_01514 [Convivina intestini]